MTLIAGLSGDRFATHIYVGLLFILDRAIATVTRSATPLAVYILLKRFVGQNYLFPTLQRRDGAASAFTF
jgi:hypothetical protein